VSSTTVTGAPRGATPPQRKKKADHFWLKVWLLRALMAISFFGTWEWAVRAKLINGFFFGQPSRIWAEFVSAAGDGSLLWHTWVTLSETLLAFAGGVVVGTVFGLLMWFSRVFAVAFYPVLMMWNATPKIALGPMFIIWIGIGYWMKVALGFSLVFVIAWVIAYDATRQLDNDLERLLKSLGASKWQIFSKVVVPGTIPWVISAFRLCIGLALTGTVVGEFITANEGLGFLISYASGSYALNVVWVALFTLMVLSTVLNIGVGALETAMLKHRAATQPGA
jgi:NitT/TauT family transport system permease protein